jgi:hypothetical protein
VDTILAPGHKRFLEKLWQLPSIRTPDVDVQLRLESVDIDWVKLA